MARLLHEVGAPDYNALWQWSVDDIGRFWKIIWDRYQIEADGDPGTALASDEMPGTRWFPGAALSYPEHIFRSKDPDAVAVQHASEIRPLQAWTWAQLHDQTARIRAGLRRLGVGRGDRVAGYLPNIPETLAAFLATASLGAIWSCCSPDFGIRAATDRFGQIEPKVLLAVDGYRYSGQDFDRRATVDRIEASLPALRATVRLGHLRGEGDWPAVFPATRDPLEFERLPFAHPLWIVYSSGTTGQPKPIVHGHGGPLLEHLKAWRLHHDIRPGDRVLWHTTTGWIMWNYLAGALLSDASVVLYDGHPGHPDLGRLWDLAGQASVHIFGASAAYLHACMRAGISPRANRRLTELRAIGSTGSPLAPEAYQWVREQLGQDIWLASASGGTDVASAFVGGSPLMPVYPGEIPARQLGVAVEAWNQDGEPVTDEVGELVVTKPMPSMPVRFWNDPDERRYRAAYFATFPGVWRHGDWIRITAHGSAVIYGRSDATINRAGVRIGTAEIYGPVLQLSEVTDALAVDVPQQPGTAESRLVLFVVLAAGQTLTADLTRRLRDQIRTDCSPRHVPDEIIAAPGIPRTRTGKILEVPVRNLLTGYDPQAAASRDSLANPEAFDWFAQFASDSLRRNLRADNATR
jgi:acetoacetyl-CoA synthetase